MKIIFIISICLFLVALIIVIWGALTRWKFVCNKRDNYSEQKSLVGPDGRIHRGYNFQFKQKNQNYSLHILLATIGRKKLFNMINSILPQLQAYDYLTVVYDAKDIDNTLPQVEKLFKDTKATCTIYMESKNLGFWGHGIRNKWASKLAGDFILHADDDNIYYPDIFNIIRKNCTNPETLYLFQVSHNNGKRLVPNPKKPIKTLNIDTACGVIPRVLNTKGLWKLEYGGDGKFYEQIIKLSPQTVFIQKNPIINHSK